MRLRAVLGVGVFALLAIVAADADAAPKKKAKPKKPVATEPAGDEEFSREAAVATITAVDLQKCRATNAEKGEGHVTITFSASGSPSKAVVDKGPWVGTPVAKCMAAQFKKQARVPAFKGENVTVGKTFKFE